MAARRRQRGTGSITWLDPSKVLLRYGGKSKTVRVSSRDHGGRSEAKDAMVQWQAELEAAEEARGAWTLGDAFDAYIREVGIQGKAGGTITSYQQVKGRLSADVLDTPLDDLTPGALREEREHLVETYSNGTLNTTLQVVKAVCNFAIADEKMTRANPVPKPLKVNRRRVTLTPRETFQAIREALDANDWPVAVAILLAAVTGARRAELSGLRWEDIDVERRVVRISRQWSVGHDGRMGVHELKSETGTDDEGRRAVYVELDALAILGAYQQHLRDAIEREPEGWLLSYNGGTSPLKPQNLGRLVNKHLDKIAEGATMHSLRRMSSSELAAAGVDVVTASSRQGHTAKMFLDTYAKAREDKQVEAGRMLDERYASQGLNIAELLPPANT